MAALGGVLAAAILKVVADQIGSAIGGQIKLKKNFDKDLKKMKMALESVEAVLKAAERQTITDEPTRLWLKRLTDAMYDISSITDEFEADTLPSARKISLKKCLLRFVSCLPIGPKITMANQMKMMGDELKEITDNHQSFTLTAGTSPIQLSDIRETSSIMQNKEYFVGRTDEKGKILACLSESTKKEFTVLPIYGIGGLGKTTLAKIVVDDSQFSDYSQVWIYVSQSFDLKKIGNAIISQLSKEKSQYTEMQMIHNSLRELLANKKILIVLDDLWEGNKSHLNELMDMLKVKVGESGSMIVIVTTRSEDIAMKISTIQPHKLASLTDKMCWSIIKQNSDFELRNDKEELEQIGKDIASKCGGVALAAQSLGHMLHSLKFDEWESIRNSDIWNLSDSEDTSLACVLTSLRLSYSVMPSNLKLCFAYCAIFPKGYKIVKDDLIHQWISLGFIKATNMLSTWQVGEKCIRQLAGLSFLEHSRSTSTTEVTFENDTLFTMHDLVHDLARSVMVDEILVSSKQGNIGGSCCHFALLNDCRKPLESSKIRALHFMECGESELNGSAFSSSKSMRVLDFSECFIHKLPDSIGVLKQLRYLNAPRVQVGIIPNSITRLSKLIYLNLHGSSRIKALPKAIGEIEGLAYLDLSDCSTLGKLPESFGRLKELVHLDLSNCSCVEGISAFLESLTQLQYLNLSYCRNIGDVPEALGGLCKLQYLDLSFSSYLYCCQETEVLGALNKLECLNLSGYFYPRELPRLFGSLRNLRRLNLSGMLRMSNDTFDSLINNIGNHLSNLEHLDLSDNRGIQSIPESLCILRKLHTLNLSECRHLRHLPSSIGTIKSLKFLHLNGCRYISEPPQLGSSAVSLPHILVQPGNSDSSSNLVQLQQVDPDVLQISKLENVKSVGEAQHIKLMEKKSLYDLKLKWTGDVERCVDDRMLLENLVPPSTLKRLEICGYNGVSFPAWLVLGQLPNLQHLVLRGMANMEEWNTSYSSGREHVIDKLEIRDCPLLMMKPLPPKAKKWVISNSDNVLSSWEKCTGSHIAASSSYSPVTTRLSVKYCKVPLHQWRLLQHFPGLSCLSIDNCGALTGSPEVIRQLSSLETLKLEDKVLEELPKWIGDLTSLHDLNIRKCRALKGLNENMSQLTNLQSLKLSFCCSMVSLPHLLGELTSLKELELRRCDVLRSLPESIQQLTSLKKLQIVSCYELKHVVKSEEGKMITHNQERVCLLPSSLEELYIQYCSGIKSFLEGMEQLTNLQKLVITGRPELKQWYELEENKMKLAHIKDKRISWRGLVTDPGI